MVSDEDPPPPPPPPPGPVQGGKEEEEEEEEDGDKDLLRASELFAVDSGVPGEIRDIGFVRKCSK